jgi:hypothetical protein
MHLLPAQAVSQEADHALHVPLRIAYLDQSVLPYHDGGGLSSDPAGGGGGGGAVEVNFVEFEEEAARKGEKGIEGALLYRESLAVALTCFLLCHHERLHRSGHWPFSPQAGHSVALDHLELTLYLSLFHPSSRSRTLRYALQMKAFPRSSAMMASTSLAAENRFSSSRAPILFLFCGSSPSAAGRAAREGNQHRC